MRTAIILHGKASKTKYFDPAFVSPSNASWFPWLQKQLLMRGILAQTPEMPKPWNPDYTSWSRELERFDITSDTIIVAHSCGAGFLVRWLCEHKDVYVGKVMLVAPWIDPDRSGGTGDLFEFEFKADLPERTAGVYIFNSIDDFPGAQISAKMIADAIPSTQTRDFEYGHFTEITEFNELLDVLVGSDTKYISS